MGALEMSTTPKLNVFRKIRYIGKALGVSLKAKKTLALVVSLLGFPAAFIPAAVAKLLGLFTNYVQALYEGEDTSHMAMIVLFAMIGLYLIQAVYQVMETYCVDVDKLSVKRYIEETIMDCAASVQYKYIENEKNFQDKLSFMENDGAYRVAQSINLVIKLFQALITFVTIAVSMAMIDWRILVVLLITCIPAVIVTLVQNDDNYKFNMREMKEMRMTNRLLGITSGMVYTGRAIHTLKFADAYQWLKKKWRASADDYLRKKLVLTKKYVGWNLLADFLRNGVLLIVLLLTAWRIYQNPSLGLGVFMSVYLLSRQMQTVTGKLVTSGATLMSDAPYMKDFFDLQNIPREPEEDERERLQNAEIVCEHVSFTYPNSDREVLHDINIRIRQGEKIAIVGHNGSGKSTFVNLLCGLHEPTKGKLTIGEMPIYEHLWSVRNAISVVFQRFGRYESTLRENIIIGDTSRSVSDIELMEVAGHTGADQVISKQENGLDEMVGSFSEHGNNVSGGQWQRIALTRALIRKDSRLIILDEPTAALDPIAEAELYRDFAALTGDKTTLLISHRLGIASVVDRILVFDEGRIVEDGSHNDLMERNGVYAKLYRAQAEWYV